MLRWKRGTASISATRELATKKTKTMSTSKRIFTGAESRMKPCRKLLKSGDDIRILDYVADQFHAQKY